MKNLMELQFEKYRLTQAEDSMWGIFPRDKAGIFMLPSSRHMINLRAIVSVSDGWDHVSVSTSVRCPTWDELEFVKRFFFKPDEVAMQLHLPPSDHISLHPHCLHIWRPHHATIPLPPKEMVA